jgi:superfamily II DNA or RNA helicase
MGRTCDVLLNNRVSYLSLSKRKRKLLKPLLRFRPKNYQYTPAYKYNDWDGYVNLLDERDDSIPAGLFRAIHEDLTKKTKIKFKVETDFDPVFFNRTGETSKEKKWLFQNDCLKSMLETSEQGGGLVLNATGTGKTRIAGMFFSWLEGSGVFIVDELTLLKQTRASLAATLGEKIGIVGNSKFKPRRITVATIQTMDKYRNNKEFRKWTKTLSVIIVDEVHLAMNKRAFRTTAAIKAPCIFGLTATLAIKKKHIRMKAYSLCGPVVYSYPLKRGQEEGVLDFGVVVQVNHNHQKEKRRGRMGRWARLKQYQRDYNELIVDCEKRNEIIYKLVKEGIKRKKHIVLLVERVSHLEDLSRRLKHFPHQLAYGKIHAKERFEAAQDMNAGECKLIIANTVFKKGIDISRLDVVIDGAAKKSQEDAIQKFGRGVRRHKKKKGLIYFDIADKYNRFEEAAAQRRKTFKQVGIPIISIPNDYLHNKHWSKHLYKKAERKLKQIIK